jgi:redox-sensitive bicupin YhaK (pirin superfamily)
MAQGDAMTLEILIPHLRDLGGGFTVRRMLPARARQMVGPFIFFDHFGPTDLAPGHGVDVRPHPHIGLATVTYLFDGALMHRDSLGSEQRITPGDVNWMTAGRGIVHSERSAPEDRTTGIRMHGLQTWVALPLALEDTTPSFTHVPRASLPVVEVDGVRIVVVAGHAFGQRAPTPTTSDTLYAAADLRAGASLEIPIEHEERALYIVSGNVAIDGVVVSEAQMAVLGPGESARVTASDDAIVMLVGGARLDGERFIWWNFVASSRERIEAGKEKWRAQQYGKVPGDDEFIPLPDH